MDDLTRYVFNHFSHLMTQRELSANGNLFYQGKVEHWSSEERKQFLYEKCSSDPEVLAILISGAQAF